MKREIPLLILCALFFASCNEYTPKPAGYARIDRFENKLDTFSCFGVSFLYPVSVKIHEVSDEDKTGSWFNLYYPEYDATIFCTYLPIDQISLGKILDESYQLAYSHVAKADGIQQTQYTNPLQLTSGILYDIKGAVASPVQFYITDSISNFLRGSLYFNNEVKPDSVAPVVQYIREDIINMMETLKWKDRR